MSSQQWAKVARFQHVSTAEGQLKDKVRMLRLSCDSFATHCDKESPKAKDQDFPGVQRSPPQGGELLEPLLRFAERLLGPDLEDDACLYVGPLPDWDI
eukprot:s4660_g4.t1